MTITLQLSAEEERRLREGTSSNDAAAIRQVLLRAVDSTVAELLNRADTEPSEASFEALADRLADTFASSASADHQPLSEAAVSRQGIYGDHP